MWCSKVLVAYDGSAPSAKALDLARAIGAQDERVELVFVHVMKLFALGTGAEGPLIDEANRVHNGLQQLAASLPNKAHARLLKGTSPADLIVKCALDEGCDLIIMGSRGKGGVKGYLGSVSYAVVQGSPVAVLVAKDAPETARHGDGGRANVGEPAADEDAGNRAGAPDTGTGGLDSPNATGSNGGNGHDAAGEAPAADDRTAR